MTVQPDKVKQAKLLAEFAHADQLYGSEPYMVHLEGVAAIAAKFPNAKDIGMVDVTVTAYLHDVLEDTSVQSSLIVAYFGSQIASAVGVLTKQAHIPYKDYIGMIRMNHLALLVKQADTLFNLQQSVINGNLKRISKYTKQLNMLTGADNYEEERKTENTG